MLLVEYFQKKKKIVHSVVKHVTRLIEHVRVVALHKRNIPGV